MKHLFYYNGNKDNKQRASIYRGRSRVVGLLDRARDGLRMKEIIDLGFGVSVERITSDCSKIHNLKSNDKGVMNLGVKIL